MKINSSFFFSSYLVRYVFVLKMFHFCFGTNRNPCLFQSKRNVSITITFSSRCLNWTSSWLRTRKWISVFFVGEWNLITSTIILLFLNWIVVDYLTRNLIISTTVPLVCNTCVCFYLNGIFLININYSRYDYLYCEHYEVYLGHQCLGVLFI